MASTDQQRIQLPATIAAVLPPLEEPILTPSTSTPISQTVLSPSPTVPPMVPSPPPTLPMNVPSPPSTVPSKAPSTSKQYLDPTCTLLAVKLKIYILFTLKFCFQLVLDSVLIMWLLLYLVPTKCRLVVQDPHSMNFVVVVDGMAYPCSEGIIHNMPLLAGHYISLDVVYLDHMDVKLPIPSPNEEMTKVG